MSYGIYIARVVGAAAEGDDRLQVRVLPQMQNRMTLPDDQCPRWSFFFRDEFYAGTAAADEYVWVICNDDFSVGYILGVANYTTYTSDDSLYKQKSIPSDLREAMKSSVATLRGENYKFDGIKVTYWNNDSIHLIEKATGGTIIAFRNGTLYMLRPDEFAIMIGNTKFTMNRNSISLTGTSIKLGCNDVCVGDNPDGGVLVTTGTTGADARVSKYVRA